MKIKILKGVIFAFVICLAGAALSACGEKQPAENNEEIYTVSIADYSGAEGLLSVEITNSNGDKITGSEYKTKGEEFLTVTLETADRWNGQLWVDNEIYWSHREQDTSVDVYIRQDTAFEIKTVEDAKSTVHFVDETGGAALDNIMVSYMGAEFPARDFDAYTDEEIKLASIAPDDGTRVLWKGYWATDGVSDYLPLPLGSGYTGYIYASRSFTITVTNEYRVRIDNDTYSMIDCDGYDYSHDQWVRHGEEAQISVDPNTEYPYTVTGAEATDAVGVYTAEITAPTEISVNLQYYEVLIKRPDLGAYNDHVAVYGGMVWKRSDGYMSYEDGDTLSEMSGSGGRDTVLSLLVAQGAKVRFEVTWTYFGDEINITNAVKISQSNHAFPTSGFGVDTVWETDAVTDDMEVVITQTEKQKHTVTFETDSHLRVEPYYVGLPYADDIYWFSSGAEKEFYHGEMVSVIVAKQQHYINGWDISADTQKSENETNDLFVFYVTEDVSVKIDAVEDENHIFNLDLYVSSSRYQVEFKKPGQAEWEILDVMPDDFGNTNRFDLSNEKIYTGETVLLRFSVNYGISILITGAGEPDADGVYTITMGHEDIEVLLTPTFGEEVYMNIAEFERCIVKINGVLISEIPNLPLAVLGERYGFEVFNNDIITVEFAEPEGYIKVSYNPGDGWVAVTPDGNIFTVVADESMATLYIAVDFYD